MGGPNRLFMNRIDQDGDWLFEEVGGEAGVHEPFFSFPVWFWDYNNDGWLDIMAGNSDLRRLNEAGADFAREALGLPHQTEMPRLFRNRGEGTFEEVTSESGMDNCCLLWGPTMGISIMTAGSMLILAPELQIIVR